MPINRHDGESEEDFMSRCVPIEIEAGKPKDQAVAICLNVIKDKALPKENYFLSSLEQEGSVVIADRASSNRSYTPEGYLVVKNNRLARVGILKYRAGELPFIQGAPKNLDPFKVIRVYRGPEELFKDSVLESFKSKPVTSKHPELLVSPKTIKQDSVGFSKDDVGTEGEYMTSTLVVTDDRSIKEVEAGTKQISLGYVAEVIWQPGVDPHGNVYDAVQKNIRGNHIAIVPKGRCGADCRISDSEQKTKNKGDQMSVPTQNIVLDGISYECPAQTAQAFDKVLRSKDTKIQSLKDTNEKMEKQLDEKEEELKDEKEKAQKDKDKMQAELDEAKASKVKDADLDELVSQRSQLVEDARSLVEGIEVEGKSNQEIRRCVVADSCKDIEDITKKSDEYVNARFDALKSSRGSAIVNTLKDHAGGAVQDSGLSLSEQARQKKIDRNKRTGA